VKTFFLVVGSLIASMFAAWIVTIIVVSVTCDGFQPNWLCSGHGGAWIWIMPGTFVISFLILLKKILKNKSDNR
jgi:ABC-type multidrug transport system permease subunit